MKTNTFSWHHCQNKSSNTKFPILGFIGLLNPYILIFPIQAPKNLILYHILGIISDNLSP